MAKISTVHLAFVTQARNSMAGVKEYIEAGMKCTLELAADLFGEHKTVPLDVGEQKKQELKDVMLDFIRMEREYNDFVTAVDYTTEYAKTLGRNAGLVNLESTLDHKLTELRQNYNDYHLQNHPKFADLLEKLQGAEEASCSTEEVLDDDEDVAITQEIVNTKCPITAKDMVDPVRNKRCQHNYERVAILDYIKRRGRKAKCPVGGCSNTALLTSNDLEDNKSIKQLIEKKNSQIGIRPKRAEILVDLTESKD